MRTLRMVALYDTVPIRRLIEQLDELEMRRPEAWSPRARVQHRSIEGTVIDRLLALEAPNDLSIACYVPVTVRVRGQVRPAMLLALEPGGARLEGEGDWPETSSMQVATEETRIGVTVTAREGDALRIAFLTPRTVSGEHRLHSFVREALRARSTARISRRLWV